MCQVALQRSADLFDGFSPPKPLADIISNSRLFVAQSYDEDHVRL
jgi:hypothetical protein